MNIYLAVILASLILAWAVDETSRRLNMRALDPRLPKAFEGFYDADKYRASQEYSRANGRVDSVQEAMSSLVVIGFILAGGFDWLDRLARAPGLGEIPTGLVFFALLGLGADLLNLPFSLYRVFVLEERFGFNRTTPALYVADKLKVYGLAALIGGPVMAGLLYFFQTFPDTAWLWSFLALTAFTVLLQYLAPSLILPLFNKFTPLPQGELRTALEGYAKALGFELSGIFVMDGSKRSAKSNAFFTGFGSKKRIALFDTLINAHSTAEIVAILGHEVGHYRLRHILTGLVLSTVRTFVLFLLLSLFIRSRGLFDAFGMEHMSIYAGFVFFSLLYTPVSMVLAVFLTWLSRRHEFQADRFAARTTRDPGSMILALKKLTVANLGNLTPHPLHVFLNYTHPPVLQRIAALERFAAERASGGQGN